MNTWNSALDLDLINNNYQKVAEFYEELINQDPIDVSNYYFLGLAYLLGERESEAQATWLYILNEEGASVAELSEILETEVQRQLACDNLTFAWLVRGYLRELNPEEINNLLNLVDLEIKLDIFNIENLENYQLESLLVDQTESSINLALLWDVIPKVAIITGEKGLGLVEAATNYIYDSSLCADKLDSIAQFWESKNPKVSVKITEMCLRLLPNSLYFLKNLALFYRGSSLYEESIKIAQQLEQKTDELGHKAYFSSVLLECLFSGGYWEDVMSIFEHHKNLVTKAIANNSCPGMTRDGSLLPVICFFYCEDNPRINRVLINQVANMFQRKTRFRFNDLIISSQGRKRDSRNKIRIGYIAHTLKTHSVGWLSRWLFHYHDHDKYEVYTYLIDQQEDNFTQEWFRKNSDKCYRLLVDSDLIYEQILSDEIDILVDLDSITNHITCQVLALKPAPIQISWLGYDGSGIPAVDYFIADPYALPSEAQEYYSETIWRLPHTYLGIDGFEVGVPTVTRESLDIEPEAVVFMNSQGLLKLHPDILKLQLQIIRNIPDSYLVVKGNQERRFLGKMYEALTAEVGVNMDRLRFLGKTATELEHRANLGIVDVMLDTYPYNGATTTLETLWMEIPLVTRVGEQFSARNSYTFMINAGITEGIAWTDEEYVEWGVRLGTDENLRKEVSWKLRQSKKTSPLWNGKQFTRDMEDAYRQMWEIYVKQNINT